jgi:hypothetical protein
VVEQDPAAGTEAERGTAVDVTVSTGSAQKPPTQLSPTASPSASPVSDEETQKAAEEAAKEREKALEEARKETKED